MRRLLWLVLVAGCTDHTNPVGVDQPLQVCKTVRAAAIAFDAASVYVTTLEGGTVLKCPKAGGPPEIVWSGLARTAGIAVDATSAYWTDEEVSGTVSACPKIGCAVPAVLASNQSYVTSIAIDDTNAYWQSGPILACAKAGCGSVPTVLAPDQGSQTVAHGIALDTANVYWTSSAGTVMTCAKAGCGGVPTLLVSGSSTPHSLAVDAANLYWTTQGSGGVWTCPVGSCRGSATKLAPSGSGDITIDATTVYWTSEDAVLACAKTGCSGTPETLAMVFHPEAIAVDDSGVYWSDSGGTVMRLPK